MKIMMMAKVYELEEANTQKKESKYLGMKILFLLLNECSELALVTDLWHYYGFSFPFVKVIAALCGTCNGSSFNTSIELKIFDLVMLNNLRIFANFLVHVSAPFNKT
jgi:hypothetical protein